MSFYPVLLPENSQYFDRVKAPGFDDRKADGNIRNFLEEAQQNTPLFDVRAPLEYAKGHIPGAISLPLFSDEERALVGTCYKKVGQRQAIELGVKLVGPKLHDLLECVKLHAGSQNVLRLYCWRGGMRSGFMSMFLNFVGFKTTTLQGGYKAYRHFSRELFQKPYDLHIIGGLTGSGKTELLAKMPQWLDLEKLAAHRGSSFGQEPGTFQPTQEQFENLMANALMRLDEKLPIFVEDESHQIGSLAIPLPFFEAMKRAPLFFVKVPIEERVERIIQEYGNFPRSQLIECTTKLMKRLGRERCKEVVEAIEQERAVDTVKILLEYYDKSYTHALETKHQGQIIRGTRDELISRFSYVADGSKFL